MKFSLASIPLAILASTIAAQPPPPPPTYQYQPGAPSNYPPAPPQQNYPSQYTWSYYPPSQPQCIGVVPGQYPQLSDLEVNDWFTCIKNWCSALNSGSSGDGPACTLYSCLQNTATQYRRGGIIVDAGKFLQPVCAAGSVVTGALGNVVGTVLNPLGALLR